MRWSTTHIPKAWTAPHVNIHTISPHKRYTILALALLISLHSILTFTHEDYRRATALPFSPFSPPTPTSPAVKEIPDEYFLPPSDRDAWPAPGPRANATLLMLARNSDLDNVLRSVRRLEDRFNRRYRYPWVFLNEEEFTPEFRERVSLLTDAEVHFGLIPHDDWFQPDWIDEERATAGREKLAGIIYGSSVPYRNMCRFNSGFFFRHALVQRYRWYWRVEPDVHFHCDINFDPFRFMEENNKTYSFTVALREYRETVASLWETTKEFVKEHPEYVPEGNALGFVSDDDGQDFNLCHFWSNFEIADMDFWRSDTYTAYFDHLDKSGGFYYERWGDAPVHSIAAALFLPKERLHFFDEIGYTHPPFTHCPRDAGAWRAGRCGCSQDPDANFDYSYFSCMSIWDRVTSV